MTPDGMIDTWTCSNQYDEEAASGKDIREWPYTLECLPMIPGRHHPMSFRRITTRTWSADIQIGILLIFMLKGKPKN